MRRPMAVFGFTALVCSLCYVFFGDSVARVLIGLSAAGVVLLLVWGHKRPANRILDCLKSCCLAALCVLSLCCITWAYQAAPLAPLDGTARALTMEVVRQDGAYDTASYYVVEAQGLYPQAERTVRLRLRTQGDTHYTPGEVLQGTVELQAVSQGQQASMYSENVWFNAVLPKGAQLTPIATHKGFDYYAAVARGYIQTFISSISPMKRAPWCRAFAWEMPAGFLLKPLSGFTIAVWVIWCRYPVCTHPPWAAC